MLSRSNFFKSDHRLYAQSLFISPSIDSMLSRFLLCGHFTKILNAHALNKRGHIIDIARNTKLFSSMQEGDLLLLDKKKTYLQMHQKRRAFGYFYKAIY